ncbi:hypothetical protein RCG19_07720 [Neobacillus sp. OS1-2]|uniref:hypothetical protein n=1 Tax=Neobacillus sp. OS1-2 TaxID=3070680 RepID=UPI0027DEAF07|nr:hypothetical protein [Neobacillus sp. OS1-2]WML41529.1 hypothetical protein RCG19_07720 [Neobacillus sp. OS1-2]
MEPFLEILREVLKGVMRELSAYFIRKAVLENKKTTPRRSEGWFAQITNIDNHHPDGRGCREKC